MADLATTSKTELAARVSRLKNIAKAAREHTREATRRGTAVVVAGAGGFIAGVVDDRFPEVGGLPTNVLLGLGLGIAGAVDMAGDQSDILVALGGGILAGAGYEKGKQVSRELAAKA